MLTEGRNSILIPAATSSPGHVFTLWVWVCVIVVKCGPETSSVGGNLHFETLRQLFIGLSACWWTDVVIMTVSEPEPLLVCSWNQKECWVQRLVRSDPWVLITAEKSGLSYDVVSLFDGILPVLHAPLLLHHQNRNSLWLSCSPPGPQTVNVQLGSLGLCLWACLQSSSRLLQHHQVTPYHDGPLFVWTGFKALH